MEDEQESAKLFFSQIIGSRGIRVRGEMRACLHLESPNFIVQHIYNHWNASRFNYGASKSLSLNNTKPEGNSGERRAQE